MKLKQLIKGLDLNLKGSKEMQITGISSDSRTVSPGNLFIAKKGQTVNGAQFIDQAINAGAVAIATDIFDPFLDKTQIIHPDPNALEAKLAAAYYGRPSKDLYVVGVTGSKGKTTTSYLVKHLLDGLKKPSGLLSTVETIIGDNRFFSTLTTHDVISNQKWLKESIKTGAKAAVLEVSSHGLDQGRVDEIDFDVGIFTNLIPDHLDYHKTMENYVAAKKKLLDKVGFAILNADSDWGQYKGFHFGLEKGDLRATDLLFLPNGTEFRIDQTSFRIPLIGKFNVYNALAAISLGIHQGANLSAISSILASFGSVPGRLERIGNVFVDFAHTGEALEGVLQTLKEIAKEKLIVVFGAGGDRDPSRRTKMALAAEKWADLSIITSDNPRSEDPKMIAEQIVRAFKHPPLVELDRKKAIELAIAAAKPDDLVLIAGKGHQKVQIYAHQTIPFDDVEVVKAILFERHNHSF